MNKTIAKSVIKNKFWIVEDHGHKVATIQAIEEGGFAYVHDQERELFPSIKMLSKKYNISFDNARSSVVAPVHECYEYPCTERPYNQVWDLQRRLPIYSKSPKSKSYFCAGYYVVLFNDEWITEYCPKNITLQRYEYHGPYKSEAEQLFALDQLQVHHGTH